MIAASPCRGVTGTDDHIALEATISTLSVQVQRSDQGRSNAILLGAVKISGGLEARASPLLTRRLGENQDAITIRNSQIQVP
jgi:hypothetical protein